TGGSRTAASSWAVTLATAARIFASGRPAALLVGPRGQRSVRAGAGVDVGVAERHLGGPDDRRPAPGGGPGHRGGARPATGEAERCSRDAESSERSPVKCAGPRTSGRGPLAPLRVGGTAHQL